MIKIQSASQPHEWQAARRLVLDLAGWLYDTSGIDMTVRQPGFSAEIDNLADVYAAPSGCFLMATLDGTAVGSVAIKAQPDGRAELKRMYVRPEARGRGVAGVLLESAVQAAIRAEASAIWLETGRGIMDTAIAIYERRGFKAVDFSNVSVDHPAAITMEMRLAGAT